MSSNVFLHFGPPLLNNLLIFNRCYLAFENWTIESSFNCAFNSITCLHTGCLVEKSQAFTFQAFFRKKYPTSRPIWDYPYTNRLIQFLSQKFEVNKLTNERIKEWNLCGQNNFSSKALQKKMQQFCITTIFKEPNSNVKS